jgi:hypothetical protein
MVRQERNGTRDCEEANGALPKDVVDISHERAPIEESSHNLIVAQRQRIVDINT